MYDSFEDTSKINSNKCIGIKYFLTDILSALVESSETILKLSRGKLILT